jgi:hypothetical protein
MMRKQAFRLLLASAISIWAGGNALAQDAAKKPHVPLEKSVGQASRQAPASTLIVINSEGAKLEGTTLTLTGVAKSSILFADRPVRAAGHITTDELVKQWAAGPDSFEKDPPNATISVLAGADVSDAVVTLKTPKFDGTTLTFDVAVLEGDLAGASGPAALFIDHWHGWHGAGWYGVGLATGAALGAAAAAPYYPPYYHPYYHPYYYPPVNPCPPGYWLSPGGHCVYR